MRFSARLVIFSSCLLVGAASLTAGQGGPAGPGGAPGGAAAAPTNLKVLPKTWSRQQVGQLMNTFNESLGVQCAHCHAEDPAAPPPNPGQNPRLDYALDTKKEKEVARAMIQLVMDLNSKFKNVGDPAVAEKTSCFTCHNGAKAPAKAPAAGWGRGSFTLSQEGPVVPARGGGAPGGAPGGPGRGGN